MSNMKDITSRSTSPQRYRIVKYASAVNTYWVLQLDGISIAMERTKSAIIAIRNNLRDNQFMQ